LNPKIGKDSVYSNFQIMSSGYDAVNLRKKYLKNPKDLKTELSIYNMTLTDSIKVENLHEIDKPLECEFKSSFAFDKVEDKILVAPFCSFIMTENPFKKGARTYPVDMVYKKSRTFSAVIHVPEGYKLFSAPDKMYVNNDDVKIQYQVENPDNKTIRITGVYEFKKDVYGAFSFFDLKGYFNNIIDKFNEKVVLVKN